MQWENFQVFLDLMKTGGLISHLRIEFFFIKIQSPSSLRHHRHALGTGPP